jgi:hypothetical protein
MSHTTRSVGVYCGVAFSWILWDRAKRVDSGKSGARSDNQSVGGD